MASSLGSLPGLALVVFLMPSASPQIVTSVAAVLVAMLALGCGLVLRIPENNQATHHSSKAAVA